MIPKMQPEQIGSGADVCLSAKDGNATCANPTCPNRGKPLEGTVRQRFCDDRCRIAAFRSKQKEARKRRREDHYQRKNRARALGSFRATYGGPITPGVPRLGI